MAQATPGDQTQQRVWDRFVRTFHWSLVVGFATSFLSGEFGWMSLHVVIGYGIAALLVARIIWGFTSQGHARFSHFIYPLSETLAYARSLRSGHPRHYWGHNPLGALMVFALLGLCLLLVLTGLLTLGTEDYEGPFVFLANSLDDATVYAIEAIHESLPAITLGFVSLHVGGVVISSHLHGENLIRSMMTGNKTLPDKTRPNH